MKDGDPQVDRPRPHLGPDESAATSLEWALLLAAIAIPSYYVFATALGALLGHYQMITTLTALPLP